MSSDRLIPLGSYLLQALAETADVTGDLIASFRPTHDALVARLADRSTAKQQSASASVTDAASTLATGRRSPPLRRRHAGATWWHSWAARLNMTASGAPVGWEVPCDSAGYVAVLGVIDRDLAFDDPVGTLYMDISGIPDEIICEGWGYYTGVEGIAGVLVRLEVAGGAPFCG